MQHELNSAELVAETEKSEDQQGWLATFADLMSLLMCFFVLLLSFSEMDAMKFKQIAGSMKQAFGVQRDLEFDKTPLGTSVIAQEFSPAVSETTLLNDIRQQSSEQLNPNLAANNSSSINDDEFAGREQEAQDKARFEIERQLQSVLAEELRQGQFELDNQGQQLVIRIKETGSFASGSGYLQPRLRPALERLAEVLAQIPGKISVAGHTDNQPLSNELFSDNLELSAARAIAVVRVLKTNPALRWVDVSAMADSQPLKPNNSRSNRAINRRVEITVHQGQPKVSDLSVNQFGGVN